MVVAVSKSGGPAGRGDSSANPNPAYEIFWNVWETHCALLFRLSLHWTQGRRADAEDALSVAKLKAFLRFGARSSDIINERAWLIRLLYTTCIDMYRKRSREQARAEDLERVLDSGEVMSGALSPEQRILQNERSARVSELFEELPGPWREAMVERCLRRKSYGEIARESGTTPANVRKKVQLARAFLRRRLDS